MSGLISPLKAEGVVHQCVQGDARAWERLYASHAQMTRKFLHRLGVESEALDDAVQEVFLEAFRYLPRFRGDCSFKTWLYRLCVTQAKKARRAKRVGSRLFRVMSTEPGPASTHGDLGDFQTGHLISSALGQLADKERLVFVLYEMEGLSGKEIAQVAECPEATVWRRLHYGRKTFVDYVEARGGLR